MATEPTDTRQTILEASRALFNQRPPARVTTADIAAAAGIAEGNLHYHFRRKADLLVALYDAFDDDVRGQATGGGEPFPDVAALLDHQREWFRLMWRHRWFYRDPASLFALAPELRPRMKADALRLQHSLRGRFGRLTGTDLREAPDDEIERLITNVWIVSLYWINYLGLLTDRDVEQADLDWGFAQVLALWRPYLTPAGQRIADEAGLPIAPEPETRAAPALSRGHRKRAG